MAAVEKIIKTLPVDTDSTSKGYITYNPKKFDIRPISPKIKLQELQEKVSYTAEVSSSCPKQSASNFTEFYGESNRFLNTSRFLNTFELVHSKLTSKVSDSVSELPDTKHETNLEGSNDLFRFWRTNLKNTSPDPKSTNDLNVIQSSYPVKDFYTEKQKISDDVSSNEVEKVDKAFNKECYTSFTTIFKDAHCILNGEESSHLKSGK